MVEVEQYRIENISLRADVMLYNLTWLEFHFYFYFTVSFYRVEHEFKLSKTVILRCKKAKSVTYS